MEQPRAPHLAEEGDPKDDQRGFRRALGQFATGVAAMMRAAAISSSACGELLLLRLARSAAHPLVARIAGPEPCRVREAEPFRCQCACRRSGGARMRSRVRAVHKFTPAAEWKPGHSGVPLSWSRRARGRGDGGDHVIFIGRVERVCLEREGPPSRMAATVSQSTIRRSTSRGGPSSRRAIRIRSIRCRSCFAPTTLARPPG